LNRFVFHYDIKSSSLTNISDEILDYKISENDNFIVYAKESSFNRTDLYRYDIAQSSSAIVSQSSAGQSGLVTASGFDRSFDVSEDGRFIVFTAAAGDLVVGDTNGKDDVFVYDFKNNSHIRVSISKIGV
jgi:Tol biopolymer transport system component